MKVLELIFQVAVTTPNPIESYVKYVNISIPFTDLDYDTKIEDSPLEVYKCTTFRNYMALEDIYSDYMKVEIQHSHQIKYWSIKEWITTANSTHLRWSCKNSSIIGVKRSLKSTFFLRIFLINVVFIVTIFVSYFAACLVQSSFSKVKKEPVTLWKKLLNHDINTIKGWFNMYLNTMHTFACGVTSPLITTMTDTTINIVIILIAFPVFTLIIDSMSSVKKFEDRRSTFEDMSIRIDFFTRSVLFTVMFLIYYQIVKSWFILHPQKLNRIKLIDSHIPTNENLSKYIFNILLGTEENKGVRDKSYIDKSDMELHQLPETLNNTELNQSSKVKEGVETIPESNLKEKEEVKVDKQLSISPKSFSSVKTEVYESNNHKVITHRFKISINQEDIGEVYGYNILRVIIGIVLLIVWFVISYYYMFIGLKYISVFVVLSALLNLITVIVLYLFVAQPMFFLLMSFLVLINRKARFAFLRNLITNEAKIIYSKGINSVLSNLVKNIKAFIEQEKLRYIREVETQTQEINRGNQNQ